LSRYFATEEGARRLREAEQELEAERTRLEAEPNARVAPAGERALTPLTPVRTSQEVAAELAELKAYEEKSAAARRRRKAELERELHEASQRKSVHTQAAATNAAAYVEQLEAAYQHAFAAIETLVTAIERVHELRAQEGTWKGATSSASRRSGPSRGTCARRTAASCGGSASASRRCWRADGEGAPDRGGGMIPSSSSKQRDDFQPTTNDRRAGAVAISRRLSHFQQIATS